MNQMICDELRVLLVDDEPIILRGLKEHIHWEALHCKIECSVQSAQEALIYLYSNSIDIMICDVCMKNMTGLELIEKTRTLYPEMHYIIISAFDHFEYIRKAMRFGVDDYLLKPIDRDELSNTILRIVDNIHKKYPYQHDISKYRQNLLAKWVKSGYVVDANFHEQARLAGVNLQNRYYQCVIIEEIEMSTSNDEISQEIIKLFNYIDSFAGQNVYQCFIDGTDKIVIIVYSSNVLDTLVNICNKYEKQLKLSIGNITGQYTKVFASYYMAGCFMRIIQLTKKNILFCDEFPNADFQNENYLYDFFCLRNAVQNNDNGRAGIFIDYIMTKKTTIEVNYMKMAITLTAFIIDTFYWVMSNETYSSALHTHFTAFNSVGNINDCTKWLKQLIIIMFDLNNKTKKGFHPAVHTVIDKVCLTYNDMNLSLKTISIEIGMSPSWLGQIFFKQTGKHFNDYLMQIRLEAVMRLLADPQTKISEIAEKTGFSSPNYLNRIFKIKYRYAPHEYRNKFLEITVTNGMETKI